MNFSLAVDLRRYFYITGGTFTDESERQKTASVLDIKTLDQWSLPQLNIGRSDHSSIILMNHLFVFCGFSSQKRIENSIEGLDLLLESFWYTLTLGNSTLTFGQSAISSISSTKFVVYGGGSAYYDNNLSNFVVDLKT